MNAKTLILISCLAPLSALAGGCLQSEGEEALQQIDHQEKAWEAKDPAAGDVTAQGLVLKELAPGMTEGDLRAMTEADFTVAPRVAEYRLS